MRFRTMTIAVSDRHTAQQRGGICQERDGAGQQRHPQAAQPPDAAKERQAFAGKPAHEAILMGMRKKTHSAGSSKILLLASWNWVPPSLARLQKSWFPNQLKESSEMNLRCTFGASSEALPKSNLHKIIYLA